MKKILIAVVLMLSVSIANAQTWPQLARDGNATYIGGYWFAVSAYCLQTSYTDESGVWASGRAEYYPRGCAKGLWDAITGKIKEG